MFITAMYIYGISQDAWGFSWFIGLVCFIMDMMLAIIVSPSTKEKIIERISEEEKGYWKKRTEVEELRRIELDRKLYGDER